MTDLDLISLRHDFHRHPELGFHEDRTKAKIAQILSDLGLEVQVGVGVIGVLRSGDGGKTVGLRADMDALPITEAGGHNHSSQSPGIMHACGHDGHMTMLLGAAEQLSKTRDFDGTIVFIFQPNEEHGLGAQAMISEGLLDQHPLDEIYAIHNLPGAPAGHVSTRPGLICASESLFEIHIQGQGGHASMPQAGRDAITVGADIVQGFQTIVSRKLAPGSGAVVSVTEFLTDGQRNVLPGQAVLKGDARARTPQDRRLIEQFMHQLADGIAMAHGASARVQFETVFIETCNAPDPTKAVIKSAKAAGFHVDGNRDPMSFSEDFAHFCARVPGCFFLLGNGQDGPQGQPLHSDTYDFNDALLPIGVQLWTALVQDRLRSQC